MLVVAVVTFILKTQPRTTFMSALSIFQVGEFSLLLSTVGLQNDLLPNELYQYFLSVSIITMALTPFILQKSNKFSDFLLIAAIPKGVRKRLNNRKLEQSSSEVDQVQEWSDHVVIVGYGINGQNISRVTSHIDIPYVIVDMDYDAIEEAKRKNQPIVFGDASDPEILKHINIQKARVVVIAISDPNATKKIISSVRLFSQTVYIIVRTRFIKEIDENMKVGADEVIPEEFETSIEIFTRVLKQYMITQSDIENIVTSIRSSDYEMLTSIKPTSKNAMFQQLNIPNKEVATLHVQHGDNDIAGKSIMDSGMGQKYNVTVLAIKRGRKYISEIQPNTKIEIDDLVYIFGTSKDINALNKVIKF
jgi:CPA2 family monovalent cation:H+ antiporter-2